MAGEGVTFTPRPPDTGTGAFPGPPESTTYPDTSLLADEPPGSQASNVDLSGEVVTEAHTDTEPTGAHPGPAESTTYHLHPHLADEADDAEPEAEPEAEGKQVDAGEVEDKAVKAPAKKAPARKAPARKRA